jgi:hypothetical protein
MAALLVAMAGMTGGCYSSHTPPPHWDAGPTVDLEVCDPLASERDCEGDRVLRTWRGEATTSSGAAAAACFCDYWCRTGCPVSVTQSGSTRAADCVRAYADTAGVGVCYFVCTSDSECPPEMHCVHFQPVSDFYPIDRLCAYVEPED